MFVADLLAVLDAEGVGRAALMGYSLGARVALSTALEHPGRVRRLVSLGGSASAQRGAVDSVFFPGVIEALREDGMEAFCAGQGLGPEVTHGGPGRPAPPSSPPITRAVAALLSATDATPAVPRRNLADCTVPALWMAGTGTIRASKESQRAASHMPDAEFVPLPGRDHGGTLFPPDEVLAHALPFLR